MKSEKSKNIFLSDPYSSWARAFLVFALELSRSRAEPSYACDFALLIFSRSYFPARCFSRACAVIYIDNKERAVKTGQSEQDSQKRTVRTGQAEQDRQNRTAVTGQSKQDSQNRIARTGQSAQVS